MTLHQLSPLKWPIVVVLSSIRSQEGAEELDNLFAKTTVEAAQVEKSSIVATSSPLCRLAKHVTGTALN